MIEKTDSPRPTLIHGEGELSLIRILEDDDFLPGWAVAGGFGSDRGGV